jgi:hypothetical protein
MKNGNITGQARPAAFRQIQKAANPKRKNRINSNSCSFQTDRAGNVTLFIELAPTPDVISHIVVRRDKNHFESQISEFSDGSVRAVENLGVSFPSSFPHIHRSAMCRLHQWQSLKRKGLQDCFA